MMRKYFKIFFFLIFCFGVSYAQSNDEKELQLTGNLYSDSKILFNSYNENQLNIFADELPGKKSPVLAGVLSAIIPGSGQFYNGDWWIGGLFLAVEAVLLTTAISQDNKGDDQTASYEMYADENWSVVLYAEWLNTYQHANIQINPDESLPPWERVDWDELNAAETGSHTLPPHGEQQYYELIGKYHQYSGGWNDYTGGPNNAQISPNFSYYSGERGKANDYYNTASTMVVLVYVNHLLAAAEAVWGANRFNNNLTVNLRVENSNLVNRNEFVPTLYLKYSF